MQKIDMSAAAVTTRLKRVSQLRRLCLSLQRARINHRKENEKELSESRQAPETDESKAK
jgi:hypothetical protein